MQLIGHINNLYNTTFWAMVQQGGINNTDAELELKVSKMISSVLDLSTDGLGDGIGGQE